MAAEGPISRRGSGMRLVTLDQWEQSKGEHDVKQKEGSARHRKKAGDLGPRLDPKTLVHPASAVPPADFAHAHTGDSVPVFLYLEVVGH